MIFEKNKKFKKRFLKLSKKVKLKFAERLNVLLTDSRNQILNNHKLHGMYDGYFSIDVTGDIRAIYKIIDDEIYYFIAIGTHSELYE